MITNILAIAMLVATQQSAEPLQTKVTSDGKADLEIDQQNAGEMVCKRFTDTGSRISSRKVCKTVAEWEDQRIDNADLMRTKRGAAGGPQPNGG